MAAVLPDAPPRQIPNTQRGITTLRPNLNQGVQELASGMADIGTVAQRSLELQNRVRGDFETSKAETELVKSHLTTINSLTGDDFAKYGPTYDKSMNDAKNNALRLISDPLERAKFDNSANLMIARGSAQVAERAKAKEGDLGRASLITDVTTLSDLGLGAQSEADRVNALTLINKRIQTSRENGYIDAEAATRLSQKAAVDYATKSFELMPPATRIAALSGKPAEVDMTSQYNTQLTPAEEAQYQDWLKTLKPIQRNTWDYDLRGAFKAGAQPAANGHLPDTWKKPNHPTFSDQSQYANVPGAAPGTWNGDTYVPAKGHGGLRDFLPPDVKAQLLERAQSELVTQQNAADKARRDAIDKGIVEAGQSIMADPTKGLSAVDPGLMKQLTPDQILNLRHFADTLSTGASVKTDPVYLDQQMSLAAQDPQGFVDQWDMSRNVAHLNESDVEKLINIKSGILKDDSGTKLHLQSAFTASTIIDDTMSQMEGMKKNDTNPDQEKRKSLFKQKASQAVYNLQHQLQRENLSPDEIHSVVDPLAIQQAHNWFSPNTYAFETDPAVNTPAEPAKPAAQPASAKPSVNTTIQDVPPDIRRQIEDSLSRNGMASSDENVVSAYQTWLARKQQ